MILNLLFNIAITRIIFIKKIQEYNPNKKRKILIVSDDIIDGMLSNEKLKSIVTELFIRGGKLNISLVFMMQAYFIVRKDIRLTTTIFFIIFYYENSKQTRT